MTELKLPAWVVLLLQLLPLIVVLCGIYWVGRWVGNVENELKNLQSKNGTIPREAATSAEVKELRDQVHELRNQVANLEGKVEILLMTLSLKKGKPTSLRLSPDVYQDIHRAVANQAIDVRARTSTGLIDIKSYFDKMTRAKNGQRELSAEDSVEFVFEKK